MNTIQAKRGFTLVEILIVVAIIATLASVALVGLGPVQRSGRDTRRVSDLRQVQNGIELYFAKCGYYPGTAEAGTDCNGFRNISSWDSLEDAITGSALGVSQVPNDPRTGGTYVYGSSAGTTYVIGATLENAGAAQLRDDVDGTVEGVDCNDPVYCVQL
jgi:general secretion pathway protein G